MSTVPYTGLPNGLRRSLVACQPLIGCWCSLANPISNEVPGDST